MNYKGSFTGWLLVVSVLMLSAEAANVALVTGLKVASGGSTKIRSNWNKTFLLNRGYKQETRRRKLKTSTTDFRQVENTGLYMIEENGK